MQAAGQVRMDVHPAIRLPGNILKDRIWSAYPAHALLPDAVDGIRCLHVHPRECREHDAVLYLVRGELRMSRKNQGRYT